ncbi:MAG: hypothetical protein CSA42_06750 [Gammaproteobacteria bacterium]|nr:MAG: hypothetical protein CSA42_06750 [Gammaproteobacteria bacterium]
MENNSTNPIYIENYFSEIELLNLLNQSLGISCDSMKYEKKDSDYFLSYDDGFDNGFKIEILIAWRRGLGKSIDLLKLGYDLATKLRTRILFEAYQVIDSPTEYVLFDEEGMLYSVEVIEVEYENGVEEGIQVIEESKRRLSF